MDDDVKHGQTLSHFLFLFKLGCALVGTSCLAQLASGGA